MFSFYFSIKVIKGYINTPSKHLKEIKNKYYNYILERTEKIKKEKEKIVKKEINEIKEKTKISEEFLNSLDNDKNLKKLEEIIKLKKTNPKYIDDDNYLNWYTIHSRIWLFQSKNEEYNYKLIWCKNYKEDIIQFPDGKRIEEKEYDFIYLNTKFPMDTFRYNISHYQGIKSLKIIKRHVNGIIIY